MLHWGSDFRPSYMRIGEFIDSLSPRPVTMALTATASRTQAGEIRELLHLADPVTVTTDADRPNLRLTVVRARPGERLEAMIAWAKRHKGNGIIYKENREGWPTARRVPALRRHRRDGVPRRNEGRGQETGAGRVPRRPPARHLRHQRVRHGRRQARRQMGPQRRAMQKPRSAHRQEAGRAGRDGKPADAILYWSPGDWRWLRHAAWEAKSRAEESGDPSRIRAAQLMDSRLDAMSAYCETRRCLRRTILAMFDPPGTRRDDCSNCSNCQADGREIVKQPASSARTAGGGRHRKRGGAGRAHGPRIDPHRMPGTSRRPTRARPRRHDQGVLRPARPGTDPPAAASPNRDSNSSTGTARSPRAADPPYGT